MRKPKFDELIDALQEQYDVDLRWVANYNSKTYTYTFHHVREDLENELTGHQLDHVIHRSLAVYNKRHAEDVYFHLGESDFLVVDYERGTAFHLFLDEARGVTIMLEPDVTVTLPDTIADWRDHIRNV